MGDDCPVQVAVRVRPLVPREHNEGCQKILSFPLGQQQVTVGTKYSFSYDYVMPPEAPQEEVYTRAVKPLVQKIYGGYNSTVLAYGQTGSGKTFTMGTGDSLTTDDGTGDVSEMIGVIPRVVRDLFEGFREREQVWETIVTCSFFELYNEEINDLFAKLHGQHPVVTIRENNGEILLSGLTVEPAESPSDVLSLLLRASAGRVVGATAMNHQSSRSHAIFTINVNMAKKADPDGRDKMSSKFHLVDLAGSERAKKTQAVGDRFKEGVNINRGLLALGNVIAALGDEKLKGAHVNYRDSKLTRILQDSLGGNSNTLMIACVSPADSSMEETVNTLRYADRAKNIKNKPVINMDPLALELHRLRNENQRLRAQLLQMGVTPESEDPENIIGDTPLPSAVEKGPDSLAYAQLLSENEKFAKRLEETDKALDASLKATVNFQQKFLAAEAIIDDYKAKLEALQATMVNLNASIIAANTSCDGDGVKDQLGADSIATQTSFLGEAQEHIKKLQSQCSELLNPEPEPEQRIVDNDEQSEGAVDSESPLQAMDEKEHRERQARYGEELTNLDNMLVQKELQLKKMKSGETEMTDLRNKYEESVKHLEKEVNKLTLEKKALQKTVKISEDRRKKVQELEGKVSELRKQSTELNRLKKMKEDYDKTVKKMTEDIVGLKSMRVKHVRQMKADAEEFRRWKQASDKQVKQLKEAERKRHCALVKLERKHELQAAVLKRKTEEAAAAKRRLDDVLKKRNEVKRMKSHDTESPEQKGDKIEFIVTAELESRVAEQEGKRNLQGLLEDRKDLMEQLRRVEAIEAKGLRGRDGGDNDANIAKLKGDIELRNTQVQELQNQILELEAAKEKMRFNNSKEFHVAVKCLMNKAVSFKGLEMQARSERETAIEEAQELKRQLLEANKQLEEKAADYEERLSAMMQQNEEKVLFLLREVQKSGLPEASSADLTTDPDTLRRLEFQESEIQRLQALSDELEKQRKLNRELTLKLKEARSNSLAQRPQKAPGPSKNSYFSGDEEDEDEEEEQEISEAEDAEWDPSMGHGETPLRKAWVKSKVNPHVTSVADPKNRLFKDEVPEKKRRTFLPEEIVKCNCKASACGASRCSCRKGNRNCSEACGCNVDKCLNRDGKRHLEVPDSSAEHFDLNLESTFVLPTNNIKRRSPRLSRKQDKENSRLEMSLSPPSAPPRDGWNRQRSRPLAEVAPQKQRSDEVALAISLEGTLNADSIEDDPNDAKTEFHTTGSEVASVAPDADYEDDEDEDDETIESTPDSFKMPKMKTTKAKKYAAEVQDQGGYFSSRYVPAHPGLDTDEVI